MRAGAVGREKKPSQLTAGWLCQRVNLGIAARSCIVLKSDTAQNSYLTERRDMVQKPENCRCFLCGRNGAEDPLDGHHVFGGSYRRKSEKYGLVVYLCHNRCHIFGPSSVHRSGAQMRRLRRYGQLKCMREQGWSEERFIQEFGKSYLGGNNGEDPLYEN